MIRYGIDRGKYVRNLRTKGGMDGTKSLGKKCIKEYNIYKLQ